MKKYPFLLILVLSFTTLSLNAQNVSMGINMNTGLSKPASNIFGEYKPYSSNSLGLSMSLNFNEKSSFIYELTLIQMTSWFSSENQELMSNQPPSDSFSIDNKDHLIYIGVPMYYRHSFDKIALRVGLQTMLPIIAYSRLRSEGFTNGEAFDNDIRYSNSLSYQIKMGPKVGLDYELNEKFYVSLDYYHGIFNSRRFSELRAINGITYARQFMLGINYNLKRKK